MSESLLFYGGLAGIGLSLSALLLMLAVFPRRRRHLLRSIEEEED